MSEAVSVLPFPAVSARKSLKDELADRGIPVIPKSEVRAHKKAYVREMRPGLWRVGVPVLLVLDKLLEFTSLAILTEIRARKESKQDTRDVVWSGLIFSLGVSSLFAGWIPGTIPLASMSLAMCLFCNGAVQRRVGSWVKVKLVSFCKKSTIPARIRSRIATVEDIEGSTVEIDMYETDPLVLVSRGPWYWKETEYFGAWNTGNPKLDSY